MQQRFTLVLAVAACSSTALAGDVVIDGRLDANYVQKPIAVQDTQTGFGDSNLGVINFANGSELDALYVLLDDDHLHLLVAGNLESNFNKLELFLDYRKGGQNRLRGDNADVDFNGLNRMGDDGNGNGLTFDDDFAADYYLTTTCGGKPFATYCNIAELLTEGGGFGAYIGSGGAGAKAPLVAENGVMIGYDNSNVAGVTGGNDLSSGLGVTTGIEIMLPLAILPGYDGGDIKVCVMINGQGHDYLSNQVLPGIGGGPNLEEPRNVNFAFVPGLQYVTIPGNGGGNPCPADFDGDGSVGASDLSVLLAAWGTNVPELDLAGDGGPVGAGDLGVLLAFWGPCP